MAVALKKQLVKLEVKPGDLVLLRPHPTADAHDTHRFAQDLAQLLGELDLGPLIIVPWNYQLEKMTQAELNERGLVRVVPEVNPGASGVDWEGYEEEAHALVRVAFARAREKLEPDAVRS